ncbi:MULTISPECIES: flagellar biosynthesis anti-sigma factor FlgM [Giesbergeria]|uniref:Negative regulator of flagellin synthesis n=1 Tax=Giesbergeria sinuosa TaxID=80883 RepID=A0ABV9QDB0_9BURK
MKIGHQAELPSAVAQARSAAAPGAEGVAKGAAAARAAGVPVMVSFSRGARELESAGDAAADFDAERVKAVRAAIAAGTFQINAGAIADRLLSDAQESLALVPARDG